MSGIQPVENLVIETIFDLYDERLTKFRETLFVEDLDYPKEYVQLVTNTSYGEDAWKYCDKRWATTGFDCIEAIIEDNEIVGMSGCKIYGDYLRTSMSLYLLKRVRRKYPGVKYLKGGWFERHIEYANKKECDGIFFTVYAYSRKLQALINNHRKRTISLVDKKHLLYMNDICEKGEYTFHTVPQTFFYYALKKDMEEFDPNEFKEVISKK